MARSSPSWLHFWSPFAALFLSPVAFAQTSGVPGPGVSSGSLLQGLFGLILVIGLLWAVLYAMRRFGGASLSGKTAGMRVVSVLPIGPRERIMLLEVQDSWIVVGVSPAGMRTLHTLPRGELPPADSAQAVPFASWLKDMAERRRNDR